MPKFRSWPLFVVTALCAAGLLGCDSKPPTPPAAPETSSSADAPPTADELASVRDMMTREQPAKMQRDSGLPPGHPPIDDDAPLQTSPNPHAPPGRLVYEKPDAWRSVPPASRMRQDQFELPATEAGVDNGEMAVFYFGPAGGGGLEANVQRWRGQFATPAGDPIPDERFERRALKVGDLDVVIVDMQGVYNATAMSFGGQAPPPAENYRMLAAIVETADGPWFFKAVGPAATIAAHEDAFMSFVQTFRVVRDAGA